MSSKAQPSQSGSDVGYNLRRQALLNALLDRESATAAQLATILGWDLREVSSKLQDLRRNGLADRDEQRAGKKGDTRLWWAT
jgi:predicted ArsR family transcriptional regulator